jgi:hypothetical protein
LATGRLVRKTCGLLDLILARLDRASLSWPCDPVRLELPAMVPVWRGSPADGEMPVTSNQAETNMKQRGAP